MKKKEYTIIQFELNQLQTENLDLTSYKRQVLTLEQEKRDLETKLLNVATESSNKAASHSVQVVGDEESKAQIDFLNSVIVDMQKKNDKLTAQLEIYETAGILGKRHFLTVQTPDYNINALSSDVDQLSFCTLPKQC